MGKIKDFPQRVPNGVDATNKGCNKKYRKATDQTWSEVQKGP
jgi:hypothetical protein